MSVIKYTNIPFKETIKLPVNLIFEKRPEIRITRKQLTKLFEFAISRTHFMFNGNFIMVKLTAWQWVLHWDMS